MKRRKEAHLGEMGFRGLEREEEDEGAENKGLHSLALQDREPLLPLGYLLINEHAAFVSFFLTRR
tara:strand:- start:173 stop:367 length:195 start_codon:yes stop_codon:yes gene_type:complete